MVTNLEVKRPSVHERLRTISNSAPSTCAATMIYRIRLLHRSERSLVYGSLSALLCVLGWFSAGM